MFASIFLSTYYLVGVPEAALETAFTFRNYVFLSRIGIALALYCVSIVLDPNSITNHFSV